MSWITERDAKDTANYRHIDFVGGRILQAKELNDLQAAEALRGKWETLGLFNESHGLGRACRACRCSVSADMKDAYSVCGGERGAAGSRV